MNSANLPSFKPTQIVRGIVIFASLALSAWIGFQYAGQAFVHPPVLLAWLAGILACFAVLYPFRGPALFGLRMNRARLGLLGLLVASFTIRLFDLPNRPPGFHPDESGYVEFAILHIFDPDNPDGTINPLRTGPDSQPVLYDYVLYLNTFLFGETIPGARMSSVVVGALAVGAVFLLMDEMAGRRMAWLSALLMSTYHYHVHWSRLALSNGWGAFLPPLALGLFLRGWQTGNPRGAVLAGLCLGLAAYVYSGGYVIILLLMLLFIKIWRDTGQPARLLAYTARMLAPAAVLAIPLVIFAFLFPIHFFGRIRTVYGWSPASLQTVLTPTFTLWDYFVQQVTRSFGAYNFQPDISGFYAPGIPFLVAAASILFLAGLGLAFRKRQWFPLAWVLLVTILGGVMMLGTPGSTHFIAVIPAICWLVALPLDALLENGHPRWAWTLLGIILLTDLVFYFILYDPLSPNVTLDLPFPLIVR